MAKRKANAQWTGTLKQGRGTMKYGTYEGLYTFASRFEEGDGTNPEELVGAAISGCYSMFLAALASEKGLQPEKIETEATVDLGRDDKGPLITSIQLNTRAKIDGISENDFQELAGKAKEGCPISRLYKGTEISLDATLV